MASTHTATVHGSTSNLGPGFDMLGLCVDLALRVTLTIDGQSSPKGMESASAEPKLKGPGPMELRGEAAGLPTGSENLLERALFAGLQAFGHPLPEARRWSVQSEIPVGRGLGSSGASTCAGLLLACQVAGLLPHGAMPNLIRLGTGIEGHPDNVVASLLGGLTLCVQTPGDFHVAKPPVHHGLGFAGAWGQTMLPTPIARKALPTSIPFAEALDQPRRTVALLEGLRLGDEVLLRHAETDYLHVHARLPLIRGGAQALQAARDAGAWLATVSGSGSSLIALGPKARMQAVAHAMQAVLEEHDGPATGRELRIVEGAQAWSV